MKARVEEHPELADLSATRNFFKTRFSEAGFQIEDKGSKGIFVSMPDRKSRLIISDQEIREYYEDSKQFSRFETAPNERSICSLDYREQLVERVGRRGSIFSFGLRRLEQTVKFSREQLPVYVEYGAATPLYRRYFRFNESVMKLTKERLEREWTTEDITDWFPGALTVRVGNISASSIQIAVEHSQKLIESSLFSMSYLRNSPLTLTVNWPTSQLPLRRPGRFVFGQHPSGENLPLPTARYNTEMTRYYQLGLSSDDPILKFLAFYQVLEYEFIAVSDEKLYQRLQRHLFDPHFTPNPKHLDRVIQEVLDYHRETDQEQMLKNILERYVDEDELMKFVSEYESYLGERLYTSQRNLFGTSVKVTLQKGHVYGNISLMIKTVRNALVHSSDRYERAERHVPFSESTERVVKDVPLMKYLAEKVIVGSATELS